MRKISLSRARRIALAAQGLHRPRPAGRIDVRHLRRVMGDLSVLQLDSVNVMARAHYMPFFSRLGPYPQDRLDDWLWHSGEHFEFWGHMISLMPVSDLPLMRHRMQVPKAWSRLERIQRERPGYVDKIRDEVLDRGPLTISELEDGGRRMGGWYRSEARVALEALFRSGQLTAVRTPQFKRVYGAPEALIPAEALEAPALSRDDAERSLIERSIERLGVADATDLADYYRMKNQSARRHLADLAAEGRIEAVAVEGWPEPAWLDPKALCPRRVEASTLLSPFDSSIWFRDRVERLWHFHYRIEIYVPEAKRRYGYYVLPFLMGEELVARVDLKSDRQGARLLVRSAWLEPDRDALRVAGALAESLRELAVWQGLEQIVVEPRGSLARELKREIESNPNPDGGSES